MTYSLFSLLIVLLVSISFAPSSHAQVYKWTDKNGKVHYSDKPIGDKTEALKMKRKPSEKEIYQANKRAKSIIHHQQKLQEIARDDASDNKAINDKLEKEESARLAFCKNAQNEIRRSGRRSYTRNDDGTHSYLSDAEKNKMIDEYKSEMVKRCN